MNDSQAIHDGGAVNKKFTNRLRFKIKWDDPYEVSLDRIMSHTTRSECGKKKRINYLNRITVFRRDNGRCQYCGREVLLDLVDSDEEQDAVAAVDHVVAKYNGGSDDLDNLKLCCGSCNSSKGYRDIEDFRASRMRQIGASFTDAQREYWLEEKVVLPVAEPFLFWFERRAQ